MRVVPRQQYLPFSAFLTGRLKERRIHHENLEAASILGYITKFVDKVTAGGSSMFDSIRQPCLLPT
jgi:hypothetical protein